MKSSMSIGMKSRLLVLTLFMSFVLVSSTVNASDKKRELIAVTGIHQDIGFLDDYRSMMHDYRVKLMGTLELMERDQSLTLNWGNLYNLKDFLEYYPQHKSKIQAFINQGRLSFPAQWVDYEPDWVPGEYMVRQCAHSIAYLQKEFDYRPVWAHLLDVPSLTPQYAQVLDKSGVKMTLMHFNYHSPDYKKNFCPPGLAVDSEDAVRGGVYDYVALDGSSVIGYLGKEHYSMLCVAWGWYNHEFGPWRQAVDRFARHFTPEEQAVGMKLIHGDEDHGLSPEKIVVLHDSIATWNSGSDYADSTLLRWGTIDEFVQRFEEKKSVLDLDRYTGQTRPWIWSGRYFERGRYFLSKAVSDLLTAEKLSSFNEMLEIASYPADEIEEAWEHILWPADHNWLAGTDTDGFKAEACYQASLQAGKLLDRQIELFASAIKSESGRRAIVVFNPSNWTRSQPVKVQLATRGNAFRVQDAGSGQWQPVWGGRPRRAGRTVMFIARDVPGLGYKTYYLEEEGEVDYYEKETYASINQSIAPVFSAKADTIENRYYRIVFDPSLGVRSIYDKKNGREMVKPGFMRLEGAFMLDSALVSPLSVSRRIRYEKKSVTVTLFNDLDLVDLNVEAEDDGFFLDAIKRFLPHEYHNLPYQRKKILASGPNLCPMEFAFNDDARLTIGIPFGAVPWVKGESNEYFPMDLSFSKRSPDKGFVSYFTGFGGLDNAVNIVKWLDIHDPDNDYGITLAYEQSQTELMVLDNSSLRIPLYVQHPLKNTVLHSPHQWYFALRGHCGDWKEAGSPNFGIELNQPLVCAERLASGNGGKTLTVEGSLLDADSRQVSVTALKKSYYDESYILRCVELTDRDLDFKVRPGLLKTITAVRTSMAEEKSFNKNISTSSMGGFLIPMKGFGIETVSIDGEHIGKDK